MSTEHCFSKDISFFLHLLKCHVKTSRCEYLNLYLLTFILLEVRVGHC